MRKKSGQTSIPKIGRPTLGIISINRKTEICRNWQRGCCVYKAAKCAFAHGAHELKHQSLDEMETTGRIPNASKFRCYPCLTWVTTGSCPYFERCVFIHDPRISGPNDAYLYSVNDHKSGSGRGGGGVGSPFGRDTFYWPDMPRTDGDGKSVPSVSVHYDLDRRMLESEKPTDRAVYYLWNSLVQNLAAIPEGAANLARSVAGAQPLERDPFSTVRTGLGNSGAASRESPPSGWGPSGAGVAVPQLSLPPCSRPWITRAEKRRLPLFERMAKGRSISPSYVPMPDISGPRSIWSDRCLSCESATRVEHRLIAPRSHRVHGSNNLRSSFPLGDINPEHGRREVYTGTKPTKQDKAWKRHGTGGENDERPPRVPLADRSESLPRRSTAPPALGRVTGTTRFSTAESAHAFHRRPKVAKSIFQMLLILSFQDYLYPPFIHAPDRPVCENRRVFGSEVVRGLFQDARQGNLEPKSNAPLVKAEARGGGLGNTGDRSVETSSTSQRRYSSDGTSFAPMPSPTFLVCDTASSHMARPSTSSTSWLSSATPPASSSAEEGDVRGGFSTLYPF